MRNKIKQIMNKEEGFTLVELLAVIVILGIIVAIAIPAVGNIIQRAQDGADEAEIQLVSDAARLYHLGEEGQTDYKQNPTGQDLVDAGYLDDREGSLSQELLTREFPRSEYYSHDAPD